MRREDEMTIPPSGVPRLLLGESTPADARSDVGRADTAAASEAGAAWLSAVHSASGGPSEAGLRAGLPFVVPAAGALPPGRGQQFDDFVRRVEALRGDVSSGTPAEALVDRAAVVAEGVQGLPMTTDEAKTLRKQVETSLGALLTNTKPAQAQLEVEGFLARTRDLLDLASRLSDPGSP